MPTQTPVFNVVRAKETARGNRALMPGMELRERLNVIAREQYGASSFYKMQKAALDALDALTVHDEFGRTCCELCGWVISASFYGSKAQHMTIHAEYEALAVLGELPPPQEDIQEQKEKGAAMIAEAQTPDEESVGIEVMVHAWFLGSLREAIVPGYWREHPSLEEYRLLKLPHEVERQRLKFGAEAYLEKYGRAEPVLDLYETRWKPAEA